MPAVLPGEYAGSFTQKTKNSVFCGKWMETKIPSPDLSAADFYPLLGCFERGFGQPIDFPQVMGMCIYIYIYKFYHARQN